MLDLSKINIGPQKKNNKKEKERKYQLKKTHYYLRELLKIPEAL